MMSRPDSLHAAGSVAAAGGRVAPDLATPGTSPGHCDWTSLNTAPGLYTITLGPGSEIDPTERVVLLSIRGVLDAHVVQILAGETDATILVGTVVLSTMVATNEPFDFVVLRVSG